MSRYISISFIYREKEFNSCFSLLQMTLDVVRGLAYILFLFWSPGVIKCYNVPCTFNTMCMCWVQDDDDDFTKMDISCMGVPFARFPGLSGFSEYCHYLMPFGINSEM